MLERRHPQHAYPVTYSGTSLLSLTDREKEEPIMDEYSPGGTRTPKATVADEREHKESEEMSSLTDREKEEPIMDEYGPGGTRPPKATVADEREQKEPEETANLNQEGTTSTCPTRLSPRDLEESTTPLTEERTTPSQEDSEPSRTPPTDTLTVLLFGKTGDGKSTLGNMLLTKGRDSSSRAPFKTGDSLSAVTTSTNIKEIGGWEVIDSVGLLSSDNDGSDSDVSRRLYEKLVTERKRIHYFCYVKKATKFSKADEKCWKQFKSLFGNHKGNIVLVFTSCKTPNWVDHNRKTMVELMGDDIDSYKGILGVDFAPHHEHDAIEKALEKERIACITELQNMLGKDPPQPVTLGRIRVVKTLVVEKIKHGFARTFKH